jgi:hypothetical protein
MGLDPRHRLMLLILGVVFVLGLQPRTAFSTEACTTIAPDRELADSGDESGIGGTGVHDARPDRTNSPGDDSDSGIGGTGIVGTVTNVDRLCVNGLEIQVPSQALSQTSTGGSNDGELAVGMVVWIRATQSGDGLVAEQIQIAPGIRGEIEAVSNNGQEVVISGQTIVLPDDVRRGPGVAPGPPATGQWRQVYGLRDENESLIASRIEVDHERMTLDGPRSVGSGAFIQWLAESGSLRSISIEGYVSGSSARPRLAGLDLEFPASIPEVQRDAFRPGRRMTAVGRISREGVLRIERPPTLDQPRRTMSIDRKAPVQSENEAIKPTSDGRPPTPESISPSEAKSDRPRGDEIERSRHRRPPTPPLPPRIDRPTRHRPPVDRPPRIDNERLR